MMTLKIGEQELNVKFGYEATLKTRLLSRFAKRSVANEKENNENVEDTHNMESIEDMLLFLPEILLVGLQKFHKEEYGFNYANGVGKEEQLDKMFSIIDSYCDIEGNDAMTLYQGLQEELMSDGFLASMFRKETEKAQAEQK